ncbi:hypothetical protein RND81_09G036700 [Saponaria officinalis]|uniref:Uncharacterized protein n=1 Tax=Saponaria officinalis TaxID=3572 RepID=A0AAW1IGC8_SAPOF
MELKIAGLISILLLNVIIIPISSVKGETFSCAPTPAQNEEDCPLKCMKICMFVLGATTKKCNESCGDVCDQLHNLLKKHDKNKQTLPSN